MRAGKFLGVYQGGNAQKPTFFLNFESQNIKNPPTFFLRNLKILKPPLDFFRDRNLKISNPQTDLRFSDLKAVPRGPGESLRGDFPKMASNLSGVGGIESNMI